jgi:hypothetical protein
MSRHFKIDLLLRVEHRAEAEGLAGNPLISIDCLHEWFADHRYKVSRTALSNWRIQHRRLGSDPVRQLRRYLTSRVETMSIEQLAEVCKLVNTLAA